MLLIALLVSTLCTVRLLAGFDLPTRHRQNGFAVAPISNASARTFSGYR
jgi:hypothetical protein